MAETFDRLSGGRLILGIGGGGSDDEFRAIGLDIRQPRDKVDAMAEAIEVLRGLWSQRPFTFAGRHFRTEAAEIEPKPDRRIPIWTGSYGPRSLGVTGRLADGWIPSFRYAPPERAGPMMERVRRAAEVAGRDPAELTFAYNVGIRVDERADPRSFVVSGAPERCAERLREFLALGFTAISLWPAGPDPAAQRERRRVRSSRSFATEQRRGILTRHGTGSPRRRHHPRDRAGGLVRVVREEEAPRGAGPRGQAARTAVFAGGHVRVPVAAIRPFPAGRWAGYRERPVRRVAGDRPARVRLLVLRGEHRLRGTHQPLVLEVLLRGHHGPADRRGAVGDPGEPVHPVRRPRGPPGHRLRAQGVQPGVQRKVRRPQVRQRRDRPADEAAAPADREGLRVRDERAPRAGVPQPPPAPGDHAAPGDPEGLPRPHAEGGVQPPRTATVAAPAGPVHGLIGPARAW